MTQRASRSKSKGESEIFAAAERVRHTVMTTMIADVMGF